MGRQRGQELERELVEQRELVVLRQQELARALVALISLAWVEQLQVAK